MLRTALFFLLDVPRLVTRRGDDLKILRQEAKAAARRRGSTWFPEPYRGQ
jgi:hypothetical protein